MALNKVEICGVNTSKLPVLKPEEKEELFRRIREGDISWTCGPLGYLTQAWAD